MLALEALIHWGPGWGGGGGGRREDALHEVQKVVFIHINIMCVWMLL